MYEVRFTPEARRDLGHVSDKVRPAIFEAIDGAVATNPQRAGKALRLQLEGLHAARRGEYRIVYAIDEDAQMVTIHRVEHRRDAYR